METSKTIKQSQRKPPRIIRGTVDRWEVKGQEQPFYIVTRPEPQRFECNCPAQSLCRHIEAVVKHLAKTKKFGIVQFWTSKIDANRQNRKTISFVAQRIPFWVTYGAKLKIVKPLPRTVLNVEVASRHYLTFDPEDYRELRVNGSKSGLDLNSLLDGEHTEPHLTGQRQGGLYWWQFQAVR